MAPIVYLPGAGGSASFWRPDYRASLPDAPPWFVDDGTDLTQRLGTIRAPTLLVWSDSDPVSPLAVARLLAERIPDARIAVVENGTHAFAAERPDEVASILRSRLALA